MDDQQFGSLVRAVRLRLGLRQADLGRMCDVGQTTVSLVERGHWTKLSVDTLRRIAGALDIRVEVLGRWRGGDGDRLLSRRHSELAESVAPGIGSAGGWAIAPEVSFSIYGERGVIDQLCWHAETRHLLVIELKTAFVDVNEMLGTLDRKSRLARTVAATRGLDPRLVSTWLIVSDTTTNRRHARQHQTLLGSRFALDGRSFAAFLRKPAVPATGIAFWPHSNSGAPRSAQRGRRLGPPPKRSGD